MPDKLSATESPQISYRPVVILLVIAIGAVAAIGFGFQAMFSDRVGRTHAVVSQFPLPGVVPNERDRRLAFEAEQRAALNGAHGRIPIEAAMDRIVARGRQAYDPIGVAN